MKASPSWADELPYAARWSKTITSHSFTLRMKKKNYLNSYEIQVRTMFSDVFNAKMTIDEAVRFLKSEQLASFLRGRDLKAYKTKARPKTSPAEDSLPQ